MEEQTVSLWVGDFRDEAVMKEYFEIRYSAGGYRIKSPFEDAFSIKHYDDDFSEKKYFGDVSKTINELLIGFSYDDQIIPKFMKYLKDGENYEGNAVIMLYNYKFHGYKLSSAGEGYKINYIGTVSYDPQIGMECLVEHLKESKSERIKRREERLKRQNDNS